MTYPWPDASRNIKRIGMNPKSQKSESFIQIPVCTTSSTLIVDVLDYFFLGRLFALYVYYRYRSRMDCGGLSPVSCGPTVVGVVCLLLMSEGKNQNSYYLIIILRSKRSNGK